MRKRIRKRRGRGRGKWVEEDRRKRESSVEKGRSKET